MMWLISIDPVVPGLLAVGLISLYSGPIRRQNRELEAFGRQQFEGFGAARTVPAAAF